MAIFSNTDRARAAAVRSLNYCNPFLGDRLEYERCILGKAFIGEDNAWHKRAEEAQDRPNIDLLRQATRELADAARTKLSGRNSAGDEERDLYENVVLYYLYNKYERELLAYAIGGGAPGALPALVMECYGAYLDDLQHYLALPHCEFPALREAPHLFALFFQLRRAFAHIFDNIIGGSRSAAILRASVWESIFTCDMARYRRSLHQRMVDITTLVTGPSGTGKELVARAVGLSGYIPFEPGSRRFVHEPIVCFHPVNLAAFSPTLIESELFGHAKGAFTGAVRDREGIFEACPSFGAVFLDEIGELDPGIQVKLLRLLQNRSFQRIGEGTDRRFSGKVIAATNRDLAALVRERKFREDMYYRLCADVIVTPSLQEQLQDSPEQLHNLVRFIADRVAGAGESEALTSEVVTWIQENLGADYSWPGNVRELEQCVRNFLVRKQYRPGQPLPESGAQRFMREIEAGQLTAEQLLQRYCALVYARTGSYQETARLLDIDRRTVKSRVLAENGC